MYTTPDSSTHNNPGKRGPPVACRCHRRRHCRHPTQEQGWGNGDGAGMGVLFVPTQTRRCGWGRSAAATWGTSRTGLRHGGGARTLVAWQILENVIATELTSIHHTMSDCAMRVPCASQPLHTGQQCMCTREPRYADAAAPCLHCGLSSDILRPLYNWSARIRRGRRSRNPTVPRSTLEGHVVHIARRPHFHYHCPHVVDMRCALDTLLIRGARRRNTTRHWLPTARQLAGVMTHIKT